MPRLSHQAGRVSGFLVVFALAVAVGVRGQSVSAPPSKTVRLLTVGNSFSQDATFYLKDVVHAQGDELIHHPAPISGGTLQQHCDKFDLHGRDANDPNGLYVSTKRSLAQELTAEPWDFITIQQASIHSHNVETYRPYAERLAEILREGSPNAQIIVHETWAYRVDDPRFEPSLDRKPGEPDSQEAMYQGLASAYRTIARELGVPLIPVGDAMYLADTDPEYGYKPDRMFDLAAAVHPALPDQTHSLHVGRKWNKLKDGRYQLRIDGHHANVPGRYLGALVFYETLYGKTAVGCTYRPNGVNAEYARFLQETAHKAVSALRGTEFEVKASVSSVETSASR